MFQNWHLRPVGHIRPTKANCVSLAIAFLNVLLAFFPLRRYVKLKPMSLKNRKNRQQARV